MVHINRTTENGFSNAGIANVPVPEIHRELAGDDVRGISVIPLHDSQRVFSLRVGHFGESKGAGQEIYFRHRHADGKIFLLELHWPFCLSPAHARKRWPPELNDQWGE